WDTRAQAALSGARSESVTTATAPAESAWSINWLPSLDSPRMATNTCPGFTRRESYSTPVTGGLPLWARTSAPCRRSRNIIKAIVLQVGKQSPFTTETRGHGENGFDGNSSSLKRLADAALVPPHQRNQHSRAACDPNHPGNREWRALQITVVSAARRRQHACWCNGRRRRGSCPGIDHYSSLGARHGRDLHVLRGKVIYRRPEAAKDAADK